MYTMHVPLVDVYLWLLYLDFMDVGLHPLRLDDTGSVSQHLRSGKLSDWGRRVSLTTYLLCQDKKFAGTWFEHAGFKSVPWHYNALSGNLIKVSQGFNRDLGGSITREIGLTRRLCNSTQIIFEAHWEICWKDGTFKLQRPYGNKRSKIVAN